MNKIVKAYQSNGFKAIRRQNLYYRLSKLKNAKDRKKILKQYRKVDCHQNKDLPCPSICWL
jgi:hypothetical protein